jgi:hypothetical protein
MLHRLYWKTRRRCWIFQGIIKQECRRRLFCRCRYSTIRVRVRPLRAPSSSPRHRTEPTQAYTQADNCFILCFNTQLGSNKRITVRQFKGKTYIDIREYYMDKNSEELKPGKKGIALTPESWQAMKDILSAVRLLSCLVDRCVISLAD